MTSLPKLLEDFPPLDFAFAYGSGVFEQKGNENVAKPLMVDLVFSAKDSYGWHKANLQRHRDHYSGLLGWMGPGAITSVQEDFGAGIYYNALVSGGRSRQWGERVSRNRSGSAISPRLAALSLLHLLLSAGPLAGSSRWQARSEYEVWHDWCG